MFSSCFIGVLLFLGYLPSRYLYSIVQGLRKSVRLGLFMGLMDGSESEAVFTA